MNRYADQGFDRRIADWLEADPNDAPDDLVRMVVGAIPSIPQRRALRLPWRFPTVHRFALLAATVGLLALGAIGVLTVGSRTPAPPIASAPPAATTAPPTDAAVSPSPAATPLAPLGGVILVEHFGNAPDGSEASADVNPDRRRLYLADPNDMTPAGMTELLPGQPATGKLSADVSPDGTRVVFHDWAVESRLYVANLDGTGYRPLTPDNARAAYWDPAFDPGGTRIVYGVHEGDDARLEIMDLATGEVTTVPGTTGPGDDAVPEAPSWSPDGRSIVFVRTTWGDDAATMNRVHYGTNGPDRAVLQVVDAETGEVTELPTTYEGSELVPGDPHWSPDGSQILFSEYPMTTMGGTGTHRMFTMAPDGSDLAPVVSVGPTGNRVVLQGDSATWTPDGRILYTLDRFFLVAPDGSGFRPVDPGAMDNTETEVGYVYVGHWVGTP
jgi:hypothetical protein